MIPQAPRYIASMRGRGYRLLPAVIPVIPPENAAASVLEPPPATASERRARIPPLCFPCAGLPAKALLSRSPLLLQSP